MAVTLLFWNYLRRSTIAFTNLTPVSYKQRVPSLSCVCVFFFSGMIAGTFYALLAGFWGAAASLCAKLSLGTDYLRDLCQSGLITDGSACEWVSLTHTHRRTMLQPSVVIDLVRCHYKTVKTVETRLQVETFILFFPNMQFFFCQSSSIWFLIVSHHWNLRQYQTCLIWS